MRDPKLKCPECRSVLVECIGSDGEDTFDAYKCPNGCELNED